MGSPANGPPSWCDPGTGWCWFQEGDTLTVTHPPSRTEMHLRESLRDQLIEALLGNGGIENLRTLDSLGIPGWESMVDALERGPRPIEEVAGDLLGLAEDPGQLWIEVQGECNEHCLHCYAESAPMDLPSLDPETVFGLIRDADQAGFGLVQFTGGDPLLWERLPEAVRRTRERGMIPEVYTNGLGLTQARYDALQAGSPRYAFSFYSYDSDAHDTITGVPGSWERTRDAIKRALEGGSRVRAAIVVMEQNEGHEDKTRDYLEGLGVDPDRIRVSYVQDVGRGESVGAADTQSGPAVRSDHYAGDDVSFNRGKLCVSYRGNVIPCIFQRWVRLGSIHQRTLREILEEPQFEQVGVLSPGDEEKEALACGDCRFHRTVLERILDNEGNISLSDQVASTEEVPTAS